MVKVNVCVALDLVERAIEKEKAGIDIYKELEAIKNPEFGFGNSFIYFRNDDEKHLQRLEGLDRRLKELKIEKGKFCAGDEVEKRTF